MAATEHNEGESEEVLEGECDGAISAIRGASPTASCKAHEPLSRGVIVLLRCQRATLRRQVARASEEAAEVRQRKRNVRNMALRAATCVVIVAVCVLIVAATSSRFPALTQALRSLLP